MEFADHYGKPVYVNPDQVVACAPGTPWDDKASYTRICFQGSDVWVVGEVKTVMAAICGALEGAKDWFSHWSEEDKRLMSEHMLAEIEKAKINSSGDFAPEAGEQK